MIAFVNKMVVRPRQPVTCVEPVETIEMIASGDDGDSVAFKSERYL
jgi:hypothetical protein